MSQKDLEKALKRHNHAVRELNRIAEEKKTIEVEEILPLLAALLEFNLYEGGIDPINERLN